MRYKLVIKCKIIIFVVNLIDDILLRNVECVFNQLLLVYKTKNIEIICRDNWAFDYIFVVCLLLIGSIFVMYEVTNNNYSLKGLQSFIFVVKQF
ncbi:hypothetical protein BUY46_11855 [Staphylococcus devriesei]|nr:hypothetical protein BUY46_11855 [Staphylococcus devriesei]